MLEWYEPSARTALKAAQVSMSSPLIWGWLIIAAFDLAPLVYVTLLPVGAGLLAFVKAQTDSCAAGAEWFAVKARWVRTYELRSVRVRKPLGEPVLVLADRGGRKIRIRLATVQRNRELWDLVHNGILHSIERGDAEADQLAREKLRLPVHYVGLSINRREESE